MKDQASNQLNEAHFREVLGHFATGVTVITTADDLGMTGFTCQAFASLSLVPPMVVLAPSRSSRSWQRIEATGLFCVNILEKSQESLARVFSTKEETKFDGIGWQAGPSGLPRILGCLAWVECEVQSVHPAGDHIIATGRAVNYESAPGQPLLFFRGGYWESGN